MRQQEVSEVKFQRLWRSIAGSVGVVMVTCGLLSVFARLINSTFTLGAIFVSILSGVILEFLAIAPDRVRISIDAFVGLPTHREHDNS